MAKNRSPIRRSTGDRIADVALNVLMLLLLAFWMHRENIRRLLRGEERKTYLSKK